MKLSSDARRILISRLGKLTDDLHEQARVYDIGSFESSQTAALREAADFLSDVRKKIQR